VALAAKKTEILAAWWGFAEADPVVVGVVVAAIACLAAGYVAMRLSRGRRGGPSAKPIARKD
jgi:hypothetical protein